MKNSLKSIVVRTLDLCIMNNRAKIWTKEDIEYLKSNINVKSLDEIAAILNRSITSVKLYMFRHEIVSKPQVKRNLMKELISIKIPAECFKPNRQFYVGTKINQMQFYNIWHGYRRASNEELKAVSQYLKVTGSEMITFFENLQLELF